MRFTSLLVIALFAYTSINAQEISDTTFGKGIINYTAKDSSFSVKFAPRIQLRSMTAWDYDGNDYAAPQSNFLVRRARLKFNGFAYKPNLKYKIELGLSNRDIAGANQFNRDTPRIILDAVVMWNFYQNFELWAGQTKLPGNVERVVSSANLQFIDRSLLNSRFNIDRDVGIQLRHFIALGDDIIIREKIAISQGEGRNVTEGNLGGHQYTGRLEILPFGNFEGSGEDYTQSDLKRQSAPKLMAGITYDYNNDAVKTRSNLGSYMFTDTGFYETDITTLFVDAMFKYQGFSFMGEYANREADMPVAVEADGITETGDVVEIGSAVNLQASYLFTTNYEVALRSTFLGFGAVTGKDKQQQYAIGVSKYIVGHKLKVQSDILYNTVDGDHTGIELRTGFELHF